MDYSLPSSVPDIENIPSVFGKSFPFEDDGKDYEKSSGLIKEEIEIETETMEQMIKQEVDIKQEQDENSVPRREEVEKENEAVTDVQSSDNIQQGTF